MSFFNNNINLYQKYFNKSNSNNISKNNNNNNSNIYNNLVKNSIVNCLYNIIINDFSYNELNQLNILDFGIKLGKQIRNKNIICILHGIETSLQKIEKAIEEDCYHRIFNVNIVEDNFVSNKKYDFILIDDIFIEGHYPFSILQILATYMKSGGLIIANISSNYKDKNIMDFNEHIINNTELVLISNIHIKEIEEDNYFYVILKKL